MKAAMVSSISRNRVRHNQQAAKCMLEKEIHLSDQDLLFAADGELPGGRAT